MCVYGTTNTAGVFGDLIVKLAQFSVGRSIKAHVYFVKLITIPIRKVSHDDGRTVTQQGAPIERRSKPCESARAAQNRSRDGNGRSFSYI